MTIATTKWRVDPFVSLKPGSPLSSTMISRFHSSRDDHTGFHHQFAHGLSGKPAHHGPYALQALKQVTLFDQSASGTMIAEHRVHG